MIQPKVNPFYHDGCWLQLAIFQGFFTEGWLPNPSDWPVVWWRESCQYHPLFNISERGYFLP